MIEKGRLIEVKQMVYIYWVVEKAKCINPVILGKENNNLFEVFIGLIYPTGCKTIDEAKRVKRFAENEYKQRFTIVKMK